MNCTGSAQMYSCCDNSQPQNQFVGLLAIANHSKAKQSKSGQSGKARRSQSYHDLDVPTKLCPLNNLITVYHKANQGHNLITVYQKANQVADSKAK